MKSLFSSAVLAITLLFSPMAMAVTHPANMLSHAIIVSDKTCPEGLVSHEEVAQKIAEFGAAVLQTHDLEGAEADTMSRALSMMTQPPTGTDSYRLYDLGNDRILISALNNRCSLGVLLIPGSLLVELLKAVSGQPA